MADGVDDKDQWEPRTPPLVYPMTEAPKPGAGDAVEIAPGVIWMRMPLGGSIAFINCWAIRDGEGWAVVDTGMQGDGTLEGWKKAFGDALQGLPVTRVLVTHMHPDHIGMAGYLTRKFDCRLWTSRLEYLMCRSLAADTGREAPDDGVRFYKAAGWDQEQIDTYNARFGGFGRGMSPLPDSFKRVTDGDVVRIGDHDWKIVTGSGHSPEHVCLWCPDLKLFISGDQVLPRITSNVSVFPTEPDGDPLRDWLTSLARIKTIVPNDVLVMPAHNDPFFGLHQRIDHLIKGHERALARLERLLAEPKRAVDVFHVLFRRKIDSWVLSMATGESLAHLNCLLHRGRAERVRDGEGVDWWKLAA